ncbi:MAG: hypothetical protein ACJ74Y_02435 [Bryobacteraceae bacterium]
MNSLAAEGEFIAFKLGIFAGLAEKSHNADQDLNREEDNPDVHALNKAGAGPKVLVLLSC